MVIVGPVVRPKYIDNINTCINWAKEWGVYYDPKVDWDDVFDAKWFIKKYSTAPKGKNAKILEEAIEDREKYMTAVTRKINKLEPKNMDKLLKKINKEIPNADGLFDILMSYRYYKTNSIKHLRYVNKTVWKNDNYLLNTNNNSNNKQ